MRSRCIIWYCPRFLGVIPVQRADYLYITHPCAKYSRPKPLSFDLHVLGTPPAFVLSQDQTLRCKSLIHCLIRLILLSSLKTAKQLTFWRHLTTNSKNLTLMIKGNQCTTFLVICKIFFHLFLPDSHFLTKMLAGSSSSCDSLGSVKSNNITLSGFSSALRRCRLK